MKVKFMRLKSDDDSLGALAGDILMIVKEENRDLADVLQVFRPGSAMFSKVYMETLEPLDGKDQELIDHLKDTGEIVDATNETMLESENEKLRAFHDENPELYEKMKAHGEGEVLVVNEEQEEEGEDDGSEIYDDADFGDHDEDEGDDN